MMIGFAAWGQDKKRMGLPKARCPKKASALSLWKKNRSLLLLLSVPTPRGACCCRANVSRLGGRASLEAIPIGRDKTKSRWFSKSKSVCAGGSGKVSRLCAIQTPQCGGMKGKLCFIKRKSKTLVSNDRIFHEKNISFFLRTGRDRIKTCGLSCETPLLFSSSSPFLGKTTQASSHLCHLPFPPPQLRTRGQTRPCASRTQRVRHSCLHPSPLPAIC